MSKISPTRLKLAFVRLACALPMVAAACALALPAEAARYSKKVEKACKSDYRAHCPAYKEGSSALRNCMSLAGRRGNLSKRCIDALTDAGMVPRKYRKR